MQPLKSIIKAMLRGALLFGLVGIFVGAVVAMIVWPDSNLGPPVGMVYGLFWGVVTGAVLGFVFGVVRVSALKHGVAHENSENITKAP
jgi:cbb3-type cytochrome oxidase subunit 1